MYVDEFLEELKKSNLSQHGWLSEDCLIAEICGDSLDKTTFFDNAVFVTVLQR